MNITREITFRGRRVDNGDWVYGSFIPDMLEIFYHDVNMDGFIKPFAKTKEARMMVEVERNTVGQYTGLNDKNGVKIFEGDIVEYQIDNDDCPFPTKNTKKRIGKVFFSEFRAGFAIAMGKMGSSIVNDNLFRYVQNGNRVCVIWNIHDNPDLLKEEKDGSEDPHRTV